MDLSAIGSGLSIKRPTIESYINALETLYLVERVYPWTKTDYARVGKQSRLFMVDGVVKSPIYCVVAFFQSLGILHVYLRS